MSPSELSHNFALIALLKTLHDEGHDSWSAFSELSLAVVDDGQTIQQFILAFYSTYKVDLPEGVAHTILARLKKAGSIDYDRRDGPFTLTKQGQSEAKKALKSAESFKAEFDLLVDDLTLYLSNRSIKVAGLEKELIAFIDENLAFTTNVVTGVRGIEARNSHAEIAAYISCLEERNGSLFRILQNLFFGRLYLQLFNKQAPIDKKAKFTKLSVYVDTNIIFGLVGLDDKRQEDSLKSLVIALGKDANVEVRVLDTTLAEARRTLLSASNGKEYYGHIPVRGLPWRLKDKGYDSVGVNALVEGLQDQLSALGIVEETATLEARDKFLKSVKALSDKFGQNKTQLAIEHDAGLLTHVAELRKGHHSNLLEKTRAILLTTDKALVQDARDEAKADNVFPTCVSPVELTCLIWLKDMGKKDLMEAALRQALMIYAREKMLDSRLWDDFMDRLASARKRGAVSEEEVALIVNSEQTRTLLFEEGDGALDQVLDHKYINHLRLESEEQEARHLSGRNEVNRIKAKKRSISHASAVCIYTFLSLLSAVVLYLGLRKLVRTIGQDGLADFLALVPLVLLLCVSIAGYVPKLDRVAQMRTNAIARVEGTIFRILGRVFY